MSVEYYGLDTDYLGFLNAQLRDLKGYKTLANELIQNADDAKGATEVVFNVTDNALIVENNGLFSDCGILSSPECPWRSDPQKTHRCDFHRFRKTASGDKRREQDTSGAFGIGFISVYQITDTPELISGKHHWRINLKEVADRRIQGLPVSSEFQGTRFILPWAFAHSQLREDLGVETLPKNISALFVEELSEHLPCTLLFLKKVRKIELKRNGNIIKTVSRTDNETTQEILIDSGEATHLWKIFEGSFEKRSRELKEKSNGRIEEKRRPIVRIAFAESEEIFNGIFYASLPTEQEIGLPFHVQADFFPSPDRKRILFDNDYQGRWNREAVNAAAGILTEALSKLPELLGHKRLWELIEKIREAHRRKDFEDLFQIFWEKLKPTMLDFPVIFSAREKWLTLKTHNRPIFVLRGKEEVKNIEVLNNLDIDLVHPDLIPFSNLLREIGIKSFAAKDLAAALQKSGLNQKKPLSESLRWIQDEHSRALIGEEIEILLERSQEGKGERQTSEEALQACAIATTKDQLLTPPKHVRQANSEIRDLFSALGIAGRFLGESNHPAIQSLVASFEASDAVQILSETNCTALNTLWLENPKHYSKILKWVTSRSAWLTDKEKKMLASLEIWPSGVSIKSLSSLAIPVGDFTDPLGLAEVIDSQILDACGSKTLVEEFGATPLTIDSYATHFVPKVFSDGKPVSEDARLDLILLLANNLGKLIENAEAILALRKCPFFVCTDGKMRSAAIIYFETELVKSLLGESASYVSLPKEHKEPLTALGKELGIKELPRAEDVIEHIKSIVSSPPDEKRKKLIEQVFVHLGTSWRKFDAATEDLDELCSLAWLPAEKDHKNWHSAKKIFSSFRKFLFSTQAVFLDINLGYQRKSAEFMEFLGVKSEPSVHMVVDHVLACSEQKLGLHREVYQFLSQNFDNNYILKLRDQRCLLIDDDSFLCPSEVFFSNHPFGKYRVTLSDDWRRFLPFLQKIGVRESPDETDAIDVLKQISYKFGRHNSPLDEESETVLYQCWIILSKALESNDLAHEFCRLTDCKVIPNRQRILNCPRYLYFEDRPRLAEKFGEELLLHVIQRHEGSWLAMEKAGVSLLSSAIDIDLLECENCFPDHDLTKMAQDRKVQIGRVFASSKIDFKLDLLDEISFFRTDKLQIRFRLRLKDRVLISDSEQTYAYYDEEEKNLYYAGAKIPWPALSRELVYAINPGGEAGQIAPGIKEVLTQETAEEAEEALDELGYAPFTLNEGKVLTEKTAGIGGTALPTEEEPVDGSPPILPYESSPRSIKDTSKEISEDPYGEKGRSDNHPPIHGNQEEKGKGGRPGSSINQPEGSTTLDGGLRGDVSSSKDSEVKDGSRDSKRTEKKKRPKQPDRLRSYVYPEHAASDEEEKSTEETTDQKIDDAGTQHVLRYEKSVGRFPEKMPHTFPGYDVESKDEMGNILRFIEIKSIGNLWGRQGVGLTDTQFLKAMELKDRYWLYVVELAEEDEANIIRIQNPAEKVNDYRFDDGWRGAAEPNSGNGEIKRKSILNLGKTG